MHFFIVTGRKKKKNPKTLKVKNNEKTEKTEHYSTY